MPGSSKKHPGVTQVFPCSNPRVFITYSPKILGLDRGESRERLGSKQLGKNRVKPGRGLCGIMSIQKLNTRVRTG